MTVTRIAVLSLAGIVAAAAAPCLLGPASAQRGGSMWTSGFGQGITEYSTGTFDEPVDGGIRIACLPRGGATLSVQIKGVDPAAGSRFLVIPVTGRGKAQTFTFTAGPDRDVKIARPRTDRQFARMWAALRGGSHVTIRYPDGSFTVQSLVGAAATLPVRPCA